MAGQALCAREKKLQIVTTGDVHGCFFDDTYTSSRKKNSLMSVKCYVDSLRQACGSENVLLLDAGDILQGDNASYYYNFVDTESEHVYPRIAACMGYDAVTLGNHDIETGHAVYDRVTAQLQARGIPVLAGNIVNEADGSTYLPSWTLIKKSGKKIAVLGFDNANIKSWLPEYLWTGLDFLSLTDCVQEKVDELRRQCRPDLVIVVVHSGSGKGDGSQLENQALDLLYSLKGVDVIVGAHDHRSYVERHGDCVYVNGGARAAAVGRVEVSFSRKGKSLDAYVHKLDKNKVDAEMKEAFAPDVEAVTAYTLQEVGKVELPLLSRESFKGMCPYINLIHSVQLSVEGARLSFAAPLNANTRIAAGSVKVNDLFSIYPFENQLFVMRMSGREIKNYLEYSYSLWLSADSSEHILNIQNRSDERSGAERWTFREASYNFDSCAGLIYNVNIDAPEGSRIEIISLADGTPFEPDTFYNVAMTSYRATGGGELMQKGAGLDHPVLEERVVARYPEIRELIRALLLEKGSIGESDINDGSRLGEWHFVPREKAERLLEEDYKKMWGE